MINNKHEELTMPRIRFTNAQTIQRLEHQIAKPMHRSAEYYEILGLTGAQAIEAFEEKVTQAKRAILADENKKRYLGNLTMNDIALVGSVPKTLLFLALQTESPEHVQALLDAGEDPDCLGASNLGAKNALMVLLQKTFRAKRILVEADLMKVKQLILAGVDLEHRSLSMAGTAPRSALGFAKDCQDGDIKNAVVAFITESMQQKGIPLIERQEERATELGKKNRELREEGKRLAEEISRKDAEIAALQQQLQTLQQQSAAAADLLLHFSHSSDHSSRHCAAVVPAAVERTRTVAALIAAADASPSVAPLTADLVTFSYPAPVLLSGSKRQREEDQTGNNVAGPSNRNDRL
jgi:hypothetical protein